MSERERLFHGDHGQVLCLANRFVSQMARVAIQPCGEMRIGLAGSRQPLFASAMTKGRVAFPSASVEVRATAPGILATQ